jgi:hypothetical protein
MTSRLIQDEVECVAGKRERFDWTMHLEDENGTQAGLDVSDVVIFRMSSTAGGAADLEFDSDTPSDNDSEIQISTRGSSSTDASGTLTLQADDTAAFSGMTKHYELNVIDSGDSNRESQPIRGRLRFLPSIVPVTP